MASGVGVHDDAVTAFNDLKLGHKHKYVTFKLSDDAKLIVVEHLVAASTWDKFVSSLPKDDCRYIIYDFDYEHEGSKNKVVFIMWAPEGAKIKSKMLYTSSKDAIKKKLNGIGAEIQATDLSEISYEAVLEKVNQRK